jgi:hypothetical protein
MFFLEALSNTRAKIVEATLLEIQDGKHTLHFWVPIWNRIIRVKSTVTIESGLTKVIQKDAGKSFDITIGKKYRLEYYIHYQNAQWKDRILFNVYPLHK